MIIGFSGPKTSGKSYVARALLESIKSSYASIEAPSLYSSGDWEIGSFADPLRNFVLDVFNMDSRHSEGYLKEVPIHFVAPSTPHVQEACWHYFGDTRPARVISGFLSSSSSTLSYRALMQYIGTEIIRKGLDEDFWVDLMETRAENSNYLISDVRMPNEAKFVRDNGILVHIENLDVKFSEEHSTEIGVDRLVGDLVFLNTPNSPQKIFRDKIKTFRQELEERLLW